MTRPPCYIYKIPLSCLTGYIATDRCPVRKQSVTPLLAPVSGGIDKCVLPKRSPLVRSKAVHPQLSDDQVRIVTSITSNIGTSKTYRRWIASMKFILRS